MRQEATIEEWRDLYRVGTKIKALKPWEKFGDTDLIGIQEKKEENTVFFSILGRDGDCCGVAAYEGYKGLNDFLMLTKQESMGLSMEYAMFSQNNLACYWGNEEELSFEQQELIRELGYHYEGKNQWMYFMSYCAGYYPYNFDQAEVQRMTRYLTQLEAALRYYDENELSVDFEQDNMYLFFYDQRNDGWSGRSRSLPFTTYNFRNLELTDTALLDKVKKAEENGRILEADIPYMGVSVNDSQYDRPGNPYMCLIGDVSAGQVLKADIVGPRVDPNILLAEYIVQYIVSYGVPEEIRVKNIIVEAILDHVCRLSDIRLQRVEELEVLDEFLDAMRKEYP